MAETAFTFKTGLAEMLKGGVIMDVTTADQAKIAEDAGARCRHGVWSACRRISVPRVALHAWPIRQKLKKL